MESGALTAGADAVLKSGIMDVASDLAELSSIQDEGLRAYLVGRREDEVVMVDSLSRKSDDAVGMCVSNVEGGLIPEDDVIGTMLSEFPQGILMVIDPYACEIAFYRFSENEAIRAKVLVME